MKPDHIHNILVPVNFSSTAINALQTAISIAKDTLVYQESSFYPVKGNGA